MKLKNSFLIVLFFCIILRTISVFPLDYRLPGGTDLTSHLFKVWYISAYGITKWNSFWYGGFSFLRFYPPLFYAISGYLGKIINFLIAYKLVIDIFYIITPLAFYYFLNEFNFSENQKIVSLIIFSLTPTYHFYFSDGRHPSLIALFFGILFWIFLKKSIEDKRYTKNVVLSSVFLSLSLLSHHLIFVLIIPITFLWAILYSFKTKTIISLLEIGILCSLITIWWWGPFVLESSESVEEGHEYLNVVGSNFSIEKILNSFGSMWRYYQFSWSEYIIFSFMGLLGILCLLSIFKWDKIILSFFAIFVISLILFVVMSYKRIFVLIPIPLSILASYILNIFKKRIQIIIIILIFVLAIASYFSIRTDLYDFPVPPIIPKDGRVIALPAGQTFRENEKETTYKVEDLVFPLYGNEFILGWYPQAISVGKYGTKKIEYDTMLSEPLKNEFNDYYQLLKEEWVNYVVVRKDDIKLVYYFNSSNKFIVINNTQKFVIFEMKQKSTYAEIDEKSAEANVSKNYDRITINTSCKKGIIKVKENYNENWVIFINGQKVKTLGTEYGFIQIESNEVEPCSIDMMFEDSPLYLFFVLISILTGFFLIVLFILKF